MLIGLFSDVHGNLPALEVVLKELKELKVDRLVCLGDTVGYGPFPNECVDLVREHCAVVLKGNHDSGLVGETPLDDFNQHGLSAILWSQKVVGPQNLDYLRGLPFLAVEHNITLAHASPLDPATWRYILTMEAAEDSFQAFSTNLCFIGHTHVPVVIGEDASINRYRRGGRYIVNVGSVGQPRDGNPAAAFGVYNTDDESYTLTRVPYDIKKTAEAIRSVGLPDFLAKRLFQGI
jgi:diadenosine tetraphosphatase ApaH/serine/threonine PP2A family protein phosphatase